MTTYQNMNDSQTFTKKRKRDHANNIESSDVAYNEIIIGDDDDFGKSSNREIEIQGAPHLKIQQNTLAQTVYDDPIVGTKHQFDYKNILSRNSKQVTDQTTRN